MAFPSSSRSLDKVIDIYQGVITMKTDPKSFICNIVIWLLAEIILNFVNLDTISDYSEFLLEQKAALIHSQLTLLSA